MQFASEESTRKDKGNIGMIFVTLGSQKFQFDRLLKKVDILISDGIITGEVFAQVGYSNYEPQHYTFKQFLDRDEFIRMETKSDLVITHGGTGAIIGALKQGKKVIAVPRLAKYGEHVDDHQIQLLQQFDGMEIIEVCYKLDDLGECIAVANQKKYEEYVSNTDRYINALDNYIVSCIESAKTTSKKRS